MSTVSSSAEGLKRLGVTEDDVKICEILLAQVVPSSKNGKKFECILGYSENRIVREKALSRLGVTEDELEVANLKALGSLGGADENRDKSNGNNFSTEQKPIQTKVEDVHFPGTTSDDNARSLTASRQSFSTYDPSVGRDLEFSVPCEHPLLRRICQISNETKLETLLGYSMLQLEREKGLKRLGVTEEHIKIEPFGPCRLEPLKSEDQGFPTKIQDFPGMFEDPSNGQDFKIGVSCEHPMLQIIQQNFEKKKLRKLEKILGSSKQLRMIDKALKRLGVSERDFELIKLESPESHSVAISAISIGNKISPESIKVQYFPGAT